jgi:hypothetical protein
LIISPYGFGGTLFAGIVGGSLGVNVGIAIPMDFFSTGSLRGTQVYISGSATPLAGLGAFAGAGENYGFGNSPSALPTGFSSSQTLVLQGGVGWGLGAEVSGSIGTVGGGLGDLSQGFNMSGSGGPRGAFGGYVAVGDQMTMAFMDRYKRYTLRSSRIRLGIVAVTAIGLFCSGLSRQRTWLRLGLPMARLFNWVQWDWAEAFSDSK